MPGEQSGDKSAAAAKIVRNHMFGSAAAGLVPIPFLDVAALGAIQLRMLSKLAAHYDVEFSKQRANAIIGALGGIGVSATAVSLLRMVPGLGTAVASVAGFALAPASTYALGQVFIKHFDSGGTFLTFDPKRAKKDYDEKLAEGKRVVEQNYAGVKP